MALDFQKVWVNPSKLTGLTNSELESLYSVFPCKRPNSLLILCVLAYLQPTHKDLGDVVGRHDSSISRTKSSLWNSFEIAWEEAFGKPLTVASSKVSREALEKVCADFFSNEERLRCAA